MLLHTLVELAQALHVPPVELLGEFAEIQVNEVQEWDELLKDRPRIEQEWIKSALDNRRKEAPIVGSRTAKAHSCHR